MIKEFYNIEEQKQRSLQIYKYFTSSVYSEFGKDDYYNKVDNDKVRQFEKLVYCFPFFTSGEQEAIKEANRIIRKQEMEFCQFSPLICLELLINHRDKIEAENIVKLESYVRDNLDEFLENDLDFVGVNDNFPMIATYIVLIGGEMFNKEDAIERGIKRLKQLERMFQRRGSQSEYNSPSYIAGQINAIALIAERSKDKDIVQMALQCEERLWVDFLGHAIPDLSQSAGPCSRMYTSGHISPVNSRLMLYILLGDKSNIAPKLPFNSDLLMCPLHCPTYLVEWYLNRKYPYEFKGTFEVNSSNDGLPHGKRRGHHHGKPEPAIRNPYEEEDLYEYQSCSGNITTYMEKNYSIGTATREFHNGLQTESFLSVYKKKEIAEQQSDIGIIFTRYVVNDKIPGQPNEYPQLGIKDSGFCTSDMGRKTCFQDKNTAIVLYKPKAYASKNVKSMRLCIVFPAKVCNPVQEIWLGKQKVKNYDGVSKEPCSIFIKDGTTLMAFHPLITSNYGRENAITVEKKNDYIIISLYNYSGEEKDFATRGFLLTGNGFVSEMRDISEYESFEAFRNEMSCFKIYDKFETNPHIRQTYTRITRYETDKTSLECEYSPVSEGIRYQMINDKLLENIKLFATDLDVAQLPYMK